MPFSDITKIYVYSDSFDHRFKRQRLQLLKNIILLLGAIKVITCMIVIFDYLSNINSEEPMTGDS